MTANLHRNWEPAAPEVAGKFYFSGTVKLGRAALSFEPHSVKVRVTNGDSGLRVFLNDKEMAFADFEGRWLGPEPEGEAWQ